MKLFFFVIALCACSSHTTLDEPDASIDGTPDTLDLPKECNPLTQIGCDAVFSCYPVAPFEPPACKPTGTVKYGLSCDDNGPGPYQQCEPGFYCEGGVCKKLCEFGNDNDCPAAEPKCYPYWTKHEPEPDFGRCL